MSELETPKETERERLVRDLKSVHEWIVLIGNRRHAAIVAETIKILEAKP